MDHPPASKNVTHWHEQSNLNLTHASTIHAHSDDLHSLSTKSHYTTRSDNIAQYQAVHESLSSKVHTSRQLVDVLDERIRSVKTSIQRTKSSLAATQAAYNAKKEP